MVLAQHPIKNGPGARSLTALTCFFLDVLGQTHVNKWSRVIASQNLGSTDYISPLRLRVL